MAKSYLEHHGDSEIVVLSLDGVVSSGSGDERLRWLNPYDIFDPVQFEKMAAIYDVTELATAVKPFLLEHLIRSTDEPWIYLDPDIAVLSPFHEVQRMLVDSPIVLTPHNLRPIPRDGLTPDEIHVLRSGAYNLGFIGVNSHALEFLDWWEKRVLRDCLIAPSEGYFVDQRWVDLAPSYFDVDLLRHPGYNIAYWNLWERPLSANGDIIRVQNHDVRFLHFSGFDPYDPKMVSRHMGSAPRVAIDDVPIWAALASAYGRQLLESGYAEFRSIGYPYDTLPDSTTLDVPMRRAYRQALLDQEAGLADAPPNPFSRPDEFQRWYRREGRFLAYNSIEWSYGLPADMRRALKALTSKPKLFDFVGKSLSLAHRTARKLGFRS